MLTEVMRQAFYEGRRSKELPLVLNDAVTILEGAWSGTIAYIISPEDTQPEPSYLIEYEDGSSEVRQARELRYDDAVAC